MTKRLLIALIAALAVDGSTARGAASTTPAASAFHSMASAQELDVGYAPSQIQAAYNFSPLLSGGIDGKGQTIALIELDTFTLSDIQQFDNANGLPAPILKEYYVGGKTFALQNTGEATLDLEWAHALAPGATIQIYYVNLSGARSSTADWKSLAQTVKQAVANGAKTISMSFGACTPTPGSGYTTTESALTAVEKQGVSVFVSSGDYGPYPGPIRDCGRRVGVSYAASDPSVVTVGGTSVTLNSDDTIASETAWRLSGGGKGNPLPRPTWQVMHNLGPGKYRYAPDVAFDANPNTGVAVYEKGQWEEVGGTSLGAPAWAAIWALVREDAQQFGKTVGAAPPIVYRIGNSSAYSKAFHDITTGSNGVYQAKVGWDAVTGWGTPDVAQFAAAVLASS
jgi:kumamolisin